MKLPNKEISFNEQIAMKYQVYNGLFLTLPFENLTEVGAELPVFTELCRSELKKGKSPNEIVEAFFQDIAHLKNFNQKMDVLFLLVQFVERQVVLVDALEDAAFIETHDLAGAGTLAQLLSRFDNAHQLQALWQLLQTYRTRVVLTAHPTQFYPPQVLGIIRDLGLAVKNNDLKQIRDLLLQLGKTSFSNPTKPTPLDEADTLIYYLEKVFYPVLKNIHYQLSQTMKSFNAEFEKLPALLELGFWPGGDRDGNPNVTTEMTLEIAARLKSKILSLYIEEIKFLRQRLTFPHIWEYLRIIEERLQATCQLIHDSQNENKAFKNSGEFLHELRELKKIILDQHQGLFVEKLESLIWAVECFGFHFVSIDLRQDSRIHTQVLKKLLDYFAQKNTFDTISHQRIAHYLELTADEKIELLSHLLQENIPKLPEKILSEDLYVNDVIGSLHAVRTIQNNNGEKALHRYIISNTQAAYNILEVMLLAHWAGWDARKIKIDVIPLFETIEDLTSAEHIMETLYNNKIYKAHLKSRNYQQVIMLGFSDGTKDGGYVTANWEIFKCKIRLSNLSKKYNITTLFFDGRGGPPARGGGNTHKFYRAMENIIEQKQVQLTIQGQTTSSMYGTKISAKYNLEQLFTSGIEASLFPNAQSRLEEGDIELMESLSCASFKAYQALKQDPLFIPYLENMTPLHYYGELNIASRPPRRSKSVQLTLSDLRAIPFVGAWSQMKQNIPGFYGLGTALKLLVGQGKEAALKDLYQRSLFFRTLLENAMQSLNKSFFPLTQYLRYDKQYSTFWCGLEQEARLTVAMLKDISGSDVLLGDDPIEKCSILLREEIVLPLLVIQQYALMYLHKLIKEGKEKDKKFKIFHKLILKSMAANINASRNSV